VNVVENIVSSQRRKFTQRRIHLMFGVPAPKRKDRLAIAVTSIGSAHFPD
jgi:hypothetical protein